MRNAPQYQPRITRPRRAATELKRLEKERDDWLSTLHPDSLFHRLFDEIPGVTYFVKDRNGRFMFAGRDILRRYKIKDSRQMLGLTDHDITPHAIAEGYVKDDRLVLTGKSARIERLELGFDSQGVLDWFVVTKLPMRDRRGRITGLMGVQRRAEEHEMRLPVMQAVSKAATIIRRDYAQPVSMLALATECGQSLRNLQRRFLAAFGISPQEFLIKTRVLAAMRLLDETSLTGAEIAAKCGFVDASSLAELFKKRTGLTPSAYRLRNRL